MNKLSILVAFIVAFASWPSLSEESSNNKLVLQTGQLSLAGAKKMLDVAQQTAEELGSPRLSIVIVDPGAEVIASIRMDGSSSANMYAAKAKAETAARYRHDTALVAEHNIKYTNQGFPTLLPSHLNMPGNFLVPGGVVIRDGDMVIGAIGVSGAQTLPDGRVVDVVVAQTAIEAVLGQ